MVPLIGRFASGHTVLMGVIKIATVILHNNSLMDHIMSHMEPMTNVIGHGSKLLKLPILGSRQSDRICISNFYL